MREHDRQRLIIDGCAEMPNSPSSIRAQQADDTATDENCDVTTTPVIHLHVHADDMGLTAAQHSDVTTTPVADDTASVTTLHSDVTTTVVNGSCNGSFGTVAQVDDDSAMAPCAKKQRLDSSCLVSAAVSSAAAKPIELNGADSIGEASRQDSETDPTTTPPATSPAVPYVGRVVTMACAIDDSDVTSFDASRVTYDEHCEDCQKRYRDPKPQELIMCLHAWKNKVDILFV